MIRLLQKGDRLMIDRAKRANFDRAVKRKEEGQVLKRREEEGGPCEWFTERVWTKCGVRSSTRTAGKVTGGVGEEVGVEGKWCTEYGGLVRPTFLRLLSSLRIDQRFRRATLGKRLASRARVVTYWC